MRKVPAKDNSRHVGRISLLLLSIVSITSALLLAEITLRGLIEPSPYSYGRLLGIELPPYRLVSAEPVRLSGDRSEWADGLIVD